MNRQNQEKTLEGYAQYVRPLPAKLMQALKLDKMYIRADGNYLYYQEDKSEVQVIDFSGGYGSTLLGHNHPELIAQAIQLLQEKVPIHAQLSIRSKTAELARALSHEIGRETGSSYVTTLTNSGAEAVEAAIKHARLCYFKKLQGHLSVCEEKFSEIQRSLLANEISLEQPVTVEGRQYPSLTVFKHAIELSNKKVVLESVPILMAAEGAFHGKTLAALSITHREQFRKPFLPEQEETFFFSHNIASIVEAFKHYQKEIQIPTLSINNKIKIHAKSFSQIAAVIVEPVLGEGGAKPVSQHLLNALSLHSKKNGVPLIFDEIQTGFFRCGEFLASFRSGIEADYYLLGKSLGGGIAKIAACIINSQCYDETFGLNHTSTFAEDDYSSSIALKALELTRAHQEKVIRLGVEIKSRLNELKKYFPNAILSVQGQGLMLGVEFKSFSESKSYGLQMLSRSGYFSYVCSAFMLNRFNVRVTPLLSKITCIRIQPAAIMTSEGIETLMHGLMELCKVIEAEDLYKLIEYKLEKSEQGLRDVQTYKHGNIETVVSVRDTPVVGFITHYIDSHLAKIADPSLALLSDKAVENLLSDMITISKPLILGQQKITNSLGEEILVVFSGLCFTSGMASRALRDNKTRVFRDLCDEAVELLENEYKACAVGLGQYTSILTQNGCSIPNSRVRLTTGNSLTIFMGVQALLNEIKKDECKQTSFKLGIIGAGGNISSTYAQLFTRYSSEIYLLGGVHSYSESKSIRTAGNMVRYVFQQLRGKSKPDSQLEKILSDSLLYKNIDQEGMSAKILWERLCRELGEKNPIKVIKSIDDLYGCDGVVVATNSSEAFLRPEHFKPSAVVYDISVPVNCTEALLCNRKGITVIYGGVVGLPTLETILLKGFPLKRGQAYACLAETLLLGFEVDHPSCSIGRIRPEQVEKMGRLSARHGFDCADSKFEISF